MLDFPKSLSNWPNVSGNYKNQYLFIISQLLALRNVRVKFLALKLMLVAKYKTSFDSSCSDPFVFSVSELAFSCFDDSFLVLKWGNKFRNSCFHTTTGNINTITQLFFLANSQILIPAITSWNDVPCEIYFNLNQCNYFIPVSSTFTFFKT